MELPGFLIAFVILANTDFVISMLSIPLNIFIIVLSVLKITKSIARTYAVNMAVMMLVNSLVLVVYGILFNLYRDHFEYEGRQRLTTFGLIVVAIRDLSFELVMNAYYFQTTLVIQLAYFGCAKPFLFQYLTRKNVLSLCFTSCCIVSFLLATSEALDLEEITSSTVRIVCTILRCIIKISAIFLMLLFYILALRSIIKYTQNRSRIYGVQVSRHSALKSIIIYSTPPNIFLLVSFPEIICKTITLVSEANNVSTAQLPTCWAVLDVTETTHSIRLFVTTVSTLIAFHEYRSAVVAIFRKCFKCCQKTRKTYTTTVVSFTNPAI